MAKSCLWLIASFHFVPEGVCACGAFTPQRRARHKSGACGSAQQHPFAMLCTVSTFLGKAMNEKCAHCLGSFAKAQLALLRFCKGSTCRYQWDAPVSEALRPPGVPAVACHDPRAAYQQQQPCHGIDATTLPV